MSASRRTGGNEESILAKLERDARKPGRKSAQSSARVVWLALAGILILVLVGALVSLAQENAARHQLAPLAQESKGAPAPVDASAPLIQRVELAPTGSTAKPGRSQRGSAAIVDERPEQASGKAEPKVLVKAVPTPLPPLVKLQSAKPAPSAPAPVKLQPAKPSSSAPAAASKVQPAKKPAPALAPAPVRSAAVRPAPPLAAANVRPAPRSVPPRAKKSAPASVPAGKPEAPAIDSDIALLSAIIMQSSSHAAERAAQQEAGALCAPGNRKCQQRSGSESGAAPKTTD